MAVCSSSQKGEQLKSRALALISVLLLLVFFCWAVYGCSTTKSTSVNADALGEQSPVAPNKKIEVAEFILGPSDKIEIIVYRHDDLKRAVQVDHSGKIIYPLIGDIQVAGLSIFQLRDRIQKGLSKYIVDPQVSIGVVAVQSQKVTVLGEVNKPGLFALDTPLTVLEAISRAGGFTVDAKDKSVLLIRGNLEKPELQRLNLHDVLSGSSLSHDVRLQNSDIIYVPATFIADVSRYFEHLYKIISPIVSAEMGYYIGQQISGKERTLVLQPQ